MPALLRRGLAAVFLVAATVPALRAQQPARRWERPGFDFRANGVWRPRARGVRQTREAALARRDLEALNAPLRGASALRAAAGATVAPTAFAVTGVLRVPVFLGRYLNSPDTTLLYARQLYEDVLFNQTPPLGRPFTIRTFYEQMSNNLLSVQGQVVGWVDLDSNDTFYQGPCNGLCGSGRVAQFLREALQKSDAALDLGQFDNDGPDGMANSPDDDGFVDLATFIHPELGGECDPSTGNVWAHRFVLSGWGGGSFTTNDPRRDGNGVPIPGQFIRVDDYTIQSGVGGTTSCDGGAIMPVGTVAHEFGHGLGLPDFYDTNPLDGDDSEGIGNWGLMSSGNYTSPFSPSHMEGFSRFELGWVTLIDLTLSGNYALRPYASADTIFRITPTVANPRTEYFLIENRQGVLGDSALINLKGPGLLIWHVDRTQYNNGFGSNTVNSGTIHGLWLMQADGLNQLRSSTQGVRNRGDAGDPFPGMSGNSTFGSGSTPAPLMNSNGAYAGFAIDSIRQVVPGGEMAFRLRFGFPYSYFVSGNGTVTTSPTTSSGGFVAQGDSVDLTAAPGSGSVFAGWSGDTATSNLTLRLRATRPWSVTASFQVPLAVQDSALRGAVVGVAYSDTVRVSGGSGSYSFAIAANGQTLPSGLAIGAATGIIAGTPTRDSTWSFTVVATSGGQTLNLPVRIVVSAPQLAAANVVDQLLLGGAHLTADEIRYLDILGNNNNGLDVGDVLAWLDDTGTVLPAPLAARLFGRPRR